MHGCWLTKCFDGCLHGPVCQGDFTHEVMNGTTDRLIISTSSLIKHQAGTFI